MNCHLCGGTFREEKGGYICPRCNSVFTKDELLAYNFGKILQTLGGIGVTIFMIWVFIRFF